MFTSTLKTLKVYAETSADEIFGVLVMKFGFDFLINRIRLFNGSKRVVTNIVEAMEYRSKEIN